MKKHPLITELQLGKSVEELIEERFSEYSWEQSEVEERLPEIIREIVRIGKSNLRFAVDTGHEHCRIFVLNDESELEIDDYYTDDGGYALTDDAYNDCQSLNEIVERLYGAEGKRAKPKLNKEQFVEKKGKVCPYCGSRKIMALDDVTFTDHDEMGCRKCGETWDKMHEKTVTGFR